MELNKQQREAVDIRDQDVFLNAGPGSGKTRVIIERIKALVSEGIPQEKILAITFTNKAVGVMKERLAEYDIKEVKCATFHKLGVDLLKQADVNFTIYDDTDTAKIIKDIAGGRISLSTMSSLVDQCKDSLEWPVDKSSPIPKDIIGICEDYDKKMKAANALDFSDLILRPVRLLQDSEFRESQANRWEHILVDETQDTSVAQFRMLELLRNDRKCTFIVGDVDQAIYEWRNARPQNILDYVRKYKPKVINMGTNYRSPSAILEPASRLIRANKARVDKEIVSALDSSGLPPRVHSLAHSWDEGEEIVKICERLTYYGDAAVLYRNGWMSAPIEMALRRAGIPYQTLDSVRFFERKEIKDMISFFRVAHNPRDIVALHRSLDVMKSGFGKVTLAKITNYDTLNGIKLNKKQDKGRALYQALISVIHSDSGNVGRSMDNIMKSTEMVNCAGESKRVDNLDTLEDLYGNMNLEQFVTEAVLDSTEEDHRGSLNLMTMHGAKGTEYPVVIVVGCENTICPHNRNDNLEEERRLFYVAMTRAKEELHLMHCYRRARFGEEIYLSPSQFLLESGLTT